jgi:CheY-like chemotaxis protein
VSHSLNGSRLGNRLKSDSERPESADDLYPMRVLLIDDGGANSPAFRRLVDAGPKGRYVVDRAGAENDAYDAIRSGDHDVYVVDHLVGARTGFDLLSWLKTTGLRKPIVFVSGSNDHGTGIAAMGAGASCYVVADAIDSGLLEHSLSNAVEQMRVLDRLSSAGISVDLDTSNKTRMLFRIAEKLREPSTAVLDVTRRSLDSALPASALRDFGLIEDKATALLTLANDLNDLAMLEAGHFRFNTEAFSLRGLVFHMNQKISTSPWSRDRSIDVAIDPDVPDALIGDPGRLRIVLISFIESVVARSSARRILVTIRTTDRRPDTVTLRFEIEAVGRGTAENHSLMADSSPVVGDDSVVILADSAALELPAALEIVSRMGGTVTVEGDQDSAASVQVAIRLQISKVAYESRPELDDHHVPDGPILVISDDAELRRSLVSSLGGANLPYLAAPSAEAWLAGQRAAGDDLELPPLAIIESAVDSFAVCDEFIEITSGRVPVVVVVGLGKRGDAARCRERGIRGYLPRPMGAGDLIDVVRSSMALTSSGDSATLVTRHWLREGRQSLHVLVVDDSSTNRFLLTRMLEQRGHSTVSAENGVEAVEASGLESFDVVLMDVMMPVMGGFEATRLIRETQSSSEVRPSIVAVSAFADSANIERAEDAGMDGFLAKPVKPEELFAAIEQRSSVVSA